MTETTATGAEPTREPSSTVLSARGLACVRDDRTLFEDLSFDVAAGELMIVEGRNGSGKTTLLRILSGIRRPDEGEVAWEGEAIDTLGADYHQYVAYVGHHDGVKRELTPLENLQFARSLGKPNDTGLEEALEKVGMLGFEDTLTHNLSAGQRRRTALARLLITDSPLWILDEPFTSLDRHGIDLTEGLVADHVAQGGMALVTAHHEIRLEGGHVKRLSLS